MIVKNQFNLAYKEGGTTEQAIECPRCSHERKKKHIKSLSVNVDKRVFRCHHCGWSDRLDGWKEEEEYQMPVRTGWSKFSDRTALFLKSRGFSIDTIKRNKIIEKKVFSGQLNKKALFVGYPYFKLGENNPVNVKWRCLEEKAFMQEKNAMPIMYNLHEWHDAEYVIIVEGENDVMAFNEVGFWWCTTTNGGAINENDRNVDGKLAAFHNCHRYFENKKTVYIATDNDGPGRRLKDELILRIGAERCKVITFPSGCKDPNDTLLAHGPSKLKECFEQAKDVPVSGIFYLSDQADAMLDTFHTGVQMGDLTHFGDLDRIFRWKKGQTNLWTGYANQGKTTFFTQAAMVKSILDGWKWAVFSPENYPALDFYNDLIEMYVGKNVTDRYGNKMSLTEYQEAMEFINIHFIFIYPEQDHTIESLHTLIAHLVFKHGVDGAIIDPYNQLESSFPGVRSDQEISAFMSLVKRFTVKHNLSYNIVVHPKSMPRFDAKDFPAADAYDINGGAMWANKADNIMSVHRPNWFIDRQDTTTSVHTQKVKRKRTGGEHGSVIFFYDFKVSRYFQKEGNGVSKYFCDPKRKKEYDDRKLQDSTQQELPLGIEEAPF